jgi:ATP/maltotriose-dependent transcriptional regulator MalT
MRRRWPTGVLSELAEVPGGVTLVIDDLHELTSPEALAQLTRLPVNLPPGVHAILAARHDVRLGLHQLRLAGELAEIRAADLRFSEQETRELLEASGVTLSEAGVALLDQRTEGWAAGLRLAAISLAGHPDPSPRRPWPLSSPTSPRARNGAGPPAFMPRSRPSPAPSALWSAACSPPTPLGAGR